MNGSYIQVFCVVAGSLPLATTYRPWVRQHFDGISSFAGNQSIGLSGTCTPAAAAIRAGATPTFECHAVHSNDVDSGIVGQVCAVARHLSSISPFRARLSNQPIATLSGSPLENVKQTGVVS